MVTYGLIFDLPSNSFHGTASLYPDLTVIPSYFARNKRIKISPMIWADSAPVRTRASRSNLPRKSVMYTDNI